MDEVFLAVEDVPVDELVDDEGDLETAEAEQELGAQDG